MRACGRFGAMRGYVVDGQICGLYVFPSQATMWRGPLWWVGMPPQPANDERWVA